MKKQVTTEIKLTPDDVEDILIKALKLDPQNTTVYYNLTTQYDQFDRGAGTPVLCEVSVKTTKDLEF